MPLKLDAKASEYITEKNMFAIVVEYNLRYFDHLPHPIVLYLDNGLQHNGFLLSQYSNRRDGNMLRWGLLVQSDEIENPAIAKIMAIEISNS